MWYLMCIAAVMLSGLFVMGLQYTRERVRIKRVAIAISYLELMKEKDRIISIIPMSRESVNAVCSTIWNDKEDCLAEECRYDARRKAVIAIAEKSDKAKIGEAKDKGCLML